MTFDYSTLCVRVTSNDLDSSREVRLNLSFVAKNYLNQIKSILFIHRNFRKRFRGVYSANNQLMFK